MKLDLTRYRRPSERFTHTFAAGEIGDDPDTYHVVGPVDLSFDVLKDKDRFRLTGTVRAALELPCSRCLEPFGLPVDAAFDVRYLPAATASAEEDREVGDEDLETSDYRDDEIDLDGLLREQFYLALPMKPLCRDGCRGLCPQCGTNLNTGSCTCVSSWEDPRLAPLRGLRRDA